MDIRNFLPTRELSLEYNQSVKQPGKGTETHVFGLGDVGSSLLIVALQYGPDYSEALACQDHQESMISPDNITHDKAGICALNWY